MPGTKRMKVINVVGARPNFMKIAPIHERMRDDRAIDAYLLHTGQHYDQQMSDVFFRQLGLPEPDFYLGVGSGGHGEQTGKVMIEFEATCRELEPDLVVVVGDVNSTIACGLVAVKMGIELAHVEAGLRSFDRTMPEEVNRVLTDQISDYLFTTERAAHENLRREGIDEARVFFVGNVMIDTLLKHRERAASRPVLGELGLAAREFVLVTLHRPANVDDPTILSGLLDTLGEISTQLPVVFPVHPRTRRQISEFNLFGRIAERVSLRLIEPLGYLDFLACMDNARFVVTDSGGIQEETTVLGVPCLTVRDNTERPATVEKGTNLIVGRDPQRLRDEAAKIIAGQGKRGTRLDLWDGKAAQRIVDRLMGRSPVAASA